MTQDEIKQLRDLADRATEGDWSVSVAGLSFGDWAAGWLSPGSAQYLAALSPERIKELCDLAADGAAYRARCALAELEDE